jgi:hypothetical protein
MKHTHLFRWQPLAKPHHGHAAAGAGACEGVGCVGVSMKYLFICKTVFAHGALLWITALIMISQSSIMAQTVTPSPAELNSSASNTDISNSQEKKITPKTMTRRDSFLSHPNFGAAYRNSGATFFFDADDASMPIHTIANPVLPHSRWNPPKRLVMKHFSPNDTAWIERDHFMQRVWEVEGGDRDHPIAFLSVDGGLLKPEDNKFVSLVGSGGAYGYFKRDPTFPGGALPDWTAQASDTLVDFEDNQVLFYATEYQLINKKKYSCQKNSVKGCILYRAQMRLSVIVRPKNYEDFWNKGPRTYFGTNEAVKNIPRLYAPYATYPVVDVFIEDKNGGGNRFHRLFYTRSKSAGIFYWLAH